MKKESQLSLVVAGAAMVVGFFLSFIDIGAASMSGWDIVMSSRAAWTTRLALALLPLGGAALALAGMGGGREAKRVGLAMGAGILGFLFFKLAWGFLKVSGFGLWMVIAAGVVALVVGLSSRQNP